MDSEQLSVPAPDWSTYEETKSRRQILLWLQGNGWPVKRQTFYNHTNSGLLKKSRKGVYTKAAVKKYAENNLVHESAGQTINDFSASLATKKAEKEIARLEVVTEHERFKMDVAKGKYILRSDIEAEWVARAVVLDNGLDFLFESYLQEMVAIVGGDQAKAPHLLELLREKKNAQMQKYANMGDFKVTIDLTGAD